LANQDAPSPVRKPPPPPGIRRAKTRPPSQPVPEARAEDIEELDAADLDAETEAATKVGRRATQPPVSTETFEGAATIALTSTEALAQASVALADELAADLTTGNAAPTPEAQTKAAQPPEPSVSATSSPERIPSSVPTLERRATGAISRPPSGAIPTPGRIPPPRPPSTKTGSIRLPTGGLPVPPLAGRAPRPLGLGEVAEDNPTLMHSPGERSSIAPLVPEASAPFAALAALASEDVKAYEQALTTERDLNRAGRLHYEAGRLYELVFGDLGQASRHYGKALAALPDHVPSIVAARRVMIARGEFGNAVELFDREVQATRDTEQRAALLLLKGRLLEQHLHRPADARKVYAAAHELAGNDALVLEAQIRVDATMEAWRALADDYGRFANTVVEDGRLRAATIARRARLAEVYASDTETAAQLYEAALAVDPRTAGALDALKRLHHEQRRWRELVGVLEREVQQSRDTSVRTMALYRMGVVHAERLGNREEGIAALERAVAESPDARFVLEALARLYEQAQAYPELSNTLRRLVAASADPQQRLGYLHRVGDLSRDRLEDRDAAVAAYEAALEIDPTYVPALRALGLLYAERGQWSELVAMHEAEVAATVDTPRRAAAHTRAASILERLERRSEAMAHHEHALALDPDLSDSFRALVRLYTRANEHRKLIELYERAIDRADVERKVEYLFAMGDLHNGPLASPEQAFGTYRRVLELRPQHIGAVHAMQRTAETAAMFRELVEALELEASIVADKKDVVALVFRAASILHEDVRTPHEAIPCFKRVLELDGHHRPTLASLGRIYYATGQWNDLVEIYRLELEVTGESTAKVALLHKMGELYVGSLGQTDRAVSCFRQALKLDPRHGPSIHQLASILRERADWNALVHLSEEEVQHAPDLASGALAAFRTGEIYEEALGDKDAAEHAFAKALSLRPNDRPAADALVRVRTQLKQWDSLALELEQSARVAEDPIVAVSMLIRAAQAWADRLQDDGHAIACYQQVLALAPDDLAAHLALAELHRKRKDHAALSDSLAALERVVTDPGAKAAFLAERARVLEVHRPGSEAEQLACYRRMLELGAGNRLALDGLERLAISQGDARILAEVDARLLAATSDRALQSAHLTRMAEALEVHGERSALETYRRALELDRENLSAQRGLSRTGEAQQDAQAISEAAELAAETARTPREGADAWLRAAIVRHERLLDVPGAIRALEKALALDPDHLEAAQQLSHLYRERGEYELLVERLSRAAAGARDPKRQSSLWIEVCRVHERELGNIGAALAAIRRLSEIQPQNMSALLEQARLLTSDRRYEEAVAVLDRCVSIATDPNTLFEVHAMLGQSHEALDATEKALVHYEKALALRSDEQSLLTRVVELQLVRKRYREAGESAVRLVQIARDDSERVRGLTQLAAAASGQGRRAEAIDHLAEAVALGGPQSGAEAQMQRIAQGSEDWVRYAAALRSRLENLAGGEGYGGLVLALARTQHQQLGQPEDAMATLIEGLRRVSTHGDLRLELALRLHDRERFGEAVEQFQYLLMDDVARPDAWRGLAKSFDRLGQARERDMATVVLHVLGQATPPERAVADAWRSSCATVVAGGFAPAVAGDLFVARAQQEPAANLVAAMSEGLAKVRAPDLAKYGVGFRDKLGTRSDGSLRNVIDHVAHAVGAEDFDVYVHQRTDIGVAVEAFARPSLIVPVWLSEQPASRQVFQLAYALFNMARGLHPLQQFTSQELGVLLAAATKSVVPGYASASAPESVLEEHGRTILRGISRRKRKAFDTAAEAYARAPALDASTFLQWSRQTARRVALVFSDDLDAAIGQVVKDERIAEPAGMQRFARSPVLADLLKVWVSRPAMALRARAQAPARSLAGA